jgi:hypothetical protein
MYRNGFYESGTNTPHDPRATRSSVSSMDAMAPQRLCGFARMANCPAYGLSTSTPRRSGSPPEPLVSLFHIGNYGVLGALARILHLEPLRPDPGCR